MITRPLDLATRLRPPPRNFDWAFFVNMTLLAIFFLFFGSRFILFPSINLPARPASQTAYLPGSVVVSIKANGQIFTDTGLVNTDTQLDAWLAQKRKTSPDASLLIRNDAQVSITKILEIQSKARQAGFKYISALVEPTADAPEH